MFNSDAKLQKEDVNTFFDTLDVDKNKKVTLEDLENLCVRYLTGTTIGVPYKFSEQRASQKFWSLAYRENTNENIDWNGHLISILLT